MKSNILSILFLVIFICFKSQAAGLCESYLRLNNTKDLFRNKVSSFSDVKHMMARANDEFRNKDLVSAEASLSAILDYNPDDIIALNLISKVQLMSGKIFEARRSKEKVIHLENKYNEASYVTYAQILILDSDPAKAIEYLESVLKESPKSPVALGLISKAYIMLGELTLAKSYIDEKGELGVNDPNYQILLFEYFYRLGLDRSDFFKKALGVANSMEHSHKPKKDQERVPRAYRKALALKAKAMAALNNSHTDLKKALADIRQYEQYNQLTSSWSLLLQAEILYKLGRMSESYDLLEKLLMNSDERDLLVLAALLHIETQGQNKAVSNELINSKLVLLTPLELVEVLKLSQNLDWNYVAPSIEGAWSNISIVNQFWYSNDSVMLPASNFVSKATSTPRRVVRRRGFSS